MLHGWTGSLHSFDAVHLPGRRVIAIDLPGHGGSEDNDAGYGPDAQAVQVGHVLDQLGVSRATIVGHSMGGDVAVALWQSRPELVKDLVLVATPPDNRHTHPTLLIRSTLWPLVGPVGHNLSPDAVQRVALKVAVAPGAEVPQQAVTDLNRVSWRAYTQSFSGLREWLTEMSVPDRLQQFPGRTLVVWGAEDQFVDPTAADLFTGIADAKVVTLEASGHLPMLEATTAFNRVLQEFLRD
jgi:pimeloyl-ACP methyl ester carboxylesterase